MDKKKLGIGLGIGLAVVAAGFVAKKVINMIGNHQNNDETVECNYEIIPNDDENTSDENSNEE